MKIEKLEEGRDKRERNKNDTKKRRKEGEKTRTHQKEISHLSYILRNRVQNVEYTYISLFSPVEKLLPPCNYAMTSRVSGNCAGTPLIG